MEEFDISKIESVEFCFENCENIKVPIECFKELEIYTDKDNWLNFSCHIVDNGSVEYYGFERGISPCQRIDKYANIYSITIVNNNGYCQSGCVLWDSDVYQTNIFQVNELISYKEIKVSVERSNKKYTIREVLSNLKDGVVVVDENGNEYTVMDKKGKKHLFATFVSDYILEQLFTIKVK